MTRDIKKILVIKLSALGDFVQCLGPMKAIRNQHKDAHITLLTTRPYKNLGEKSGYFDDIWIDDRPKLYHPLKWFALRKQLNGGHFDRVYDLQNNDRTGFYFMLLNPKPEWVGIAKGASHRNTSPDRKKGLAFYGHAQTLALAGITDIQIDDMSWIETDISKFSLPEKYALIVPGSAASRPEKRWPAEHFAALCKELAKRNIQPVLIGTEEERTVTKSIAEKCSEALDLTGATSLYDIVTLGRNAVIAIGNDTGPMHMVGPTGTKTRVLFTPHSDPKRHSPLGNDVKTLEVDTMSPQDVIQNITTEL